MGCRPEDQAHDSPREGDTVRSGSRAIAAVSLLASGCSPSVNVPGGGYRAESPVTLKPR